jgi:hypothetical protein
MSLRLARLASKWSQRWLSHEHDRSGRSWGWGA